MVPFAGFDMPVVYKNQSHIDSHHWVRNKVGLFDVSHMLQHKVKGKNADAFLQKICPIDLSALNNFTSSLTVLLNEEGGILDDCIVTKQHDNEYYMVTNAGCRDQDTEFIKREVQKFSEVGHYTFESTLLAVQGPEAASLMQKFTNVDLKKLYFGHSVYTNLSSAVGSEIHLARCGYTGEDGFELSIPSSNPQQVAEAQDFFRILINDYPDLVRPIGLAARDSLRLEAGMCLYGNDLTADVTPVQANLTWLIPKSRRSLNESATFNGAEKIISQISDRSSFPSRRVGIKSFGPSPRLGNKIFSSDGSELIGSITSGSPSPSLGGNVAQGYVNHGHKIGSNVKIEIRGKLRDATISKMPFVPNHFYRG